MVAAESPANGAADWAMAEATNSPKVLGLALDAVVKDVVVVVDGATVTTTAAAGATGNPNRTLIGDFEVVLGFSDVDSVGDELVTFKVVDAVDVDGVLLTVVVGCMSSSIFFIHSKSCPL